MNPKIDKLARDIEKTEKKIADLQKKLELFKEEKTRLENEDYGDIGRDFHMTPKELAEFLKAHRAGTLTVPEAAPPAGEQEAAMKNKVRNVLAALVLCMSAVVLPVTAYASTGSDTTPPTLTATLKDDKLAVEASDDMSGVEAVYVDGTRINSLVNGKGTVALKDYAGDGKEVTVYAVDYSGNRSKEVKLDNPYYEEPAQTQAASSAAPQSSSGETQAAPSQTPAPSPSSNNASGNSESSQAAETPSASQEETGASSESSDTEDETESAVPEGAFTPEGTGTVLDSATGQEDDKQFYTITTADGNVFYLIIDGKRDSENVYFLNGVTEEDLLSLAQQDNGSESAIEVVTCNCTEKCEAGAVNTDCPVCKNDLNGCLGKVTEEPAPEETEQPEAETEKSGGNSGMIIFLVIALAAAGGLGYYFKIVRPKQQAAMDEDEFEDDGYGEDDETNEAYGEPDYLTEDDFDDKDSK